MTNDEHDSLILAKCREIANWPQVAPTMKALALSTIVAIERLHESLRLRDLCDEGTADKDALATILAAWPKEIL